MLYTKFQAPEQSGSEKKIKKNFYVSMVQNKDPQV